jgi:hypothetical protein
MKDQCVSGKKIFASQLLAEDVLIELWVKNDYTPGSAPIAVYRCDDCGSYHLTSRPPMNARLAEMISSDKFKLQKQGYLWEKRLKGK